MFATVAFLVQGIPYLTGSDIRTSLANETILPFYDGKILKTGLVGMETFLEFDKVVTEEHSRFVFRQTTETKRQKK